MAYIPTGRYQIAGWNSCWVGYVGLEMLGYVVALEQLTQFFTQAMQFVQLVGNASQKLNKKLCCHWEQCVALKQALMEPFPVISSLGTV